MGEICDDNRFELIEKYKKLLIECTNIETSPNEMGVIDNILFRFWQMGWIDVLENQIKGDNKQMRKYEVIEYEQEDYDAYEENLTTEELINNLKHINRGYIGDYNYTGEVDDFNRFTLHISLYKVIELLENGEWKLNE